MERRNSNGQFQVFDADTALLLGRVFNDAWGSLENDGIGLAGLNTERIREALALRIINLAQQGERDPLRLREEALSCASQILRMDGAAQSRNV
ncbi:MAG TPA: hypothetical protein VHG27_06865 [Xanthobacteraceae bacterium]|nr:hypothetical protein [Xanthobacteraceae bacterium]